MSARSTAFWGPSRTPTSVPCPSSRRTRGSRGPVGTSTCTIPGGPTSAPPVTRPSSRDSTSSPGKKSRPSSGTSSVARATASLAALRCGISARPSSATTPNGKTDRPGFRRADRHFQQRAFLGEVVADVAEDVLKLTAQENHGDDDSDRDDSDDESVLHETLAFVVTEECEHPNSPSFLPCSAGHCRPI